MFLIFITTLLVSASDNASAYKGEQLIQTTLSFVAKHEDDTQFEAEEAERLVDALGEIGRNAENSDALRSRSYYAIAKISWRVADKYGMKGAEYGRRAIEAIKTSLELDPSNTDAALSYARTIGQMTQQNFAIRKLIASKLAIDLKREAEAARDHLKRLGLTSSIDYPILKKYLKD